MGYTYHPQIVFIKIFNDQRITKVPTPINMVFIGSFPANLAAKGAATNPPIINPVITCQWLKPKKVKKVSALAKVTKNSERLTVPIT